MFAVELRQIWGWEDNGPHWARWWLNLCNYQFASLLFVWWCVLTKQKLEKRLRAAKRVDFFWRYPASLPTVSWFTEKEWSLGLIQHLCETAASPWRIHLRGVSVCARRDAVALPEPREYFFRWKLLGNCFRFRFFVFVLFQLSWKAQQRRHCTQTRRSHRRRSACLCNKWLTGKEKQ